MAWAVGVVEGSVPKDVGQETVILIFGWSSLFLVVVFHKLPWAFSEYWTITPVGGGVRCAQIRARYPQPRSAETMRADPFLCLGFSFFVRKEDWEKPVWDFLPSNSNPVFCNFHVCKNWGRRALTFQIPEFPPFWTGRSGMEPRNLQYVHDSGVRGKNLENHYNLSK